jgi:NADPH:quinone reductase-like Zn-dependent oxidoreductase
MYGTMTKPEDLAVLRDLMAAGKVTPIIDRTYKLSETAEAMRYFEEGHARGKVVITMEQPSLGQ